MITKIGVICQDSTSYGFLDGIRHRLGCKAEIIDPPAAIGRTRNLTYRAARDAWAYFRKKGVQLVVRFTDADWARWQNVLRNELGCFPNQARSVTICGVAVEAVEDWLALDRKYVSNELGVPAAELDDAKNRVDVVKGAIRRAADVAGQTKRQFVARFIREVPPDVFRGWLQKDRALERFYDDCRAAATGSDCETTNEKDAT